MNFQFQKNYSMKCPQTNQSSDNIILIIFISVICGPKSRWVEMGGTGAQLNTKTWLGYKDF